MNKTSNRMRRLRWLAVPLAAALLFTACGDDDEAEPAAPAPAPTEAPAPDPEPEPVDEDDGHDHDEDDGHDHEEDEGHDHEEDEGHEEDDGHDHEEDEGHEDDEPEPEPAAPPEPIDIRLVTWGGGKFIDFIDLYVAEENGYFAEAGVTLEQLPGAGAGDAVRQVVAGNADIAMADALSGFFATIAGADLEGIYCPYTQNWMTMLVNTASGVESPEDLRGKTVAVTSQASTSKWYAALLLADNGITEDDVTFAATGIAFGEALLGGQAQAASTWGSINWALLEAGGIPDDQIGDYEIWQYDQVPGPNDVYFADRSWVDENADGVGRFIDALEKAKLWIAENPEAAAEIGSRYAVGADNMDRNLAVIDYRIQMQTNGPGVDENGMGWCDVATIQDVADQATALGILPDSADASAVISNRFIN